MRYKNKNWDTLKNMVNRWRSKSVYPNTFSFDGRQISIQLLINATNTLLPSAKIWLTQLIKWQAHWKSLTPKCLGYKLTFTYTNGDDVLTLMKDLKPKIQVCWDIHRWPATQPNRIAHNLAAHHRAAHNPAARWCAGSLVSVTRMDNLRHNLISQTAM